MTRENNEDRGELTQAEWIASIAHSMERELQSLRKENRTLTAFRQAVVGWRENDWPEYFCRRTAEMVADRGREATQERPVEEKGDG
jgi:hypothetical protein